jgi:DNA-binding response OmpR family regulator
MGPIVLIVEDDASIARLVAKNLESIGMRCHHARDGATALDSYEKLHPALVILDLGLPDVSGLELARRFRERADVALLMLTARSGESDKLLGFEVGADDYLTKPFSTMELVARVRALVRRSTGAGAEAVLVRGDLSIDPSRREASRGGAAIELTSLEFDALYFLASRPGRVFSREALMNHVWGIDRVVDDRSIDSLISRLRRKIEIDPANPMHIQTVWGAGYRFHDGRSS